MKNPVPDLLRMILNRRYNSDGKELKRDDARPVKWVPVGFDTHGEAIVWDIVYADETGPEQAGGAVAMPAKAAATAHLVRPAIMFIFKYALSAL